MKKLLFFLMSSMCLVTTQAMEKKPITKKEIPSLQHMSAQALVQHLTTFIEQEIANCYQSNSNNVDELFLTNLPQWLDTYVPHESGQYFPWIWQQLFIRLLQSSQIKVNDKIALIRNHIRPSTEKKNSQEQSLISQDLFIQFNLDMQHDIIDFFIINFKKNNLQDLVSLKKDIVNSLALSGKEHWITEFFLSVVHRLLLFDTLYTYEQKYFFLQTLIKNQEELGLASVQVQDLLYELANFLRDYALQKIDANSSPFIIVHQIDSAATEMAKFAHLNDQKRRSVMDDIFCALMLSDRFTLAQKELIFDEMHKSFGTAFIFRQAQSILTVLKQYFKNSNEKVSVNSPIRTGTETTTLLHLAIIKINSNPLFAKLLIQLGANINATDSLGRTPLYNALALGSRDTVKLLLMKGASVFIIDNNNQTPLHMFFAHLNEISLMEDVIELIIDELLKYGPQLNHHDNNGNTILALWRQVSGLSPELKQKIDDQLVAHGAVL